MTAFVKWAAPAFAGTFHVPLAWVRPVAAVVLTLATLAACSRLGGGQQDEMTWARAALERNERLQVVASDPQARTFTVRMKDSGDLHVVAIDKLVAGPPAGEADAAAKAGNPSPPSAGDATAGTPGTDNAAGATSSEPGASSKTATSAEPASSTAAAPAGGVASAGSGGPNAPPDSEQAAAGATPVQGPHAEPAADAKPGSVLASGPGYSIKSSTTQGNTVRTATGLTAPRGTPLERLHDPIICQGSRLLHIDNRNLEFDGNAVAAEDGCELHITNSHIRAKGIGVLARAANVHIENSEIDGDSGSIDASDGAQVYAEASRFKGLTRHMEASAFHDLGGNVWN